MKWKRYRVQELPNIISAHHTGMPTDIAAAPMRLLHIDSVLQWPDGLMVFEDVTLSDCLVIPYAQVSEEQWAKTMVLTWRWGKPEPMPPVEGFSPMSDDQWSELLELLKIGLASAMEYIWIDWSCVPQYMGDPMNEVMRSKLFYARSAVMIAIPTYCKMNDFEASDLIILKNLLAVSSKTASFRFLSADGLTTHAILDAILKKGRYASQEYFGRAWTLSERMARFGRNEGLHHWMTLESWLGMVVDAIFVKAKSKTEEEEATIVVTMLGKKARRLVIDIQREFLAALELQAVSISSSLVANTMRVLIRATNRYSRAVKGEGEGPDPKWLRQYLSKDVTTEVYKAWDKQDLVWAVYSYFFWKKPARTTNGFSSSIQDLVDVAQCSIEERGAIAAFFGVLQAPPSSSQPPQDPQVAMDDIEMGLGVGSQAWTITAAASPFVDHSSITVFETHEIPESTHQGVLDLLDERLLDRILTQVSEEVTDADVEQAIARMTVNYSDAVSASSLGGESLLAPHPPQLLQAIHSTSAEEEEKDRATAVGLTWTTRESRMTAANGSSSNRIVPLPSKLQRSDSVRSESAVLEGRAGHDRRSNRIAPLPSSSNNSKNLSGIIPSFARRSKSECGGPGVWGGNVIVPRPSPLGRPFQEAGLSVYSGQRQAVLLHLGERLSALFPGSKEHAGAGAGADSP